ncbi:MAG: heavy metal translocating P-type ATPase metal-binding domain-containing protein [Anaerolineales bacterium]|jgi:heavy metal translocating P-type ATPase
MTPERKQALRAVETCDLCALKIDGAPVVADFDGQEKHFCCKGCARVYEIARDNDMLDQVVVRPEKRRESIKDLVFEPGETAYFSVQGMWCAGCASAAEQVLRRHPGVKSADVSFAAERGRLQYDPGQVDPDELLKDLDSLGYKTRNLLDPAQAEIEHKQEHILIQLIAAAAFGMQVMLIYLVQLYPRYAAGDFSDPEVHKLQYMIWVLATPILFVGGISFLKGAWRAIRARTATMDTLVALGTASAYIYSAYVTIQGQGEVYFDSVAMITTFVMFGRYLETLGGAQARKDIRQLLKMQPDQAWKRTEDQWKQASAMRLVTGDQILVKPGERVPADSVVVEGHAAVNEAMLTGESLPVSKGPGDPIFAGTLVSDSALIARVSRPVEGGRLTQISQLVNATLSTKPPIQRLVDRASAYFAFGIILVAVITFLAWWLARGSLAESVFTAVAVLVVACPCALGLATPLALTVTLGQATQAGLLVRNPVVLETAGHIQRVVFDKTGTLTQGEMSVVAVEPDSDQESDKQLIRQLAASVEQFSEHPIAKAIMADFYATGSETPLSAGEFQALRGFGASARVDGFQERRVLIGSDHFLEVGDESALNQRARKHTSRGDTIVWVGYEDAISGFIAVRDRPNKTAAQAIRELKQAGITPVLLSGDHLNTTAAVAQELGLEVFAGNCPPSEKSERIKNWQQSGEQVAMVGDGVNDAPALAQADISIAMAGGTDVAGETSDVLLMNPDLTLVPWLIERSKRTRWIIMQNLGWAFAYNLISVPLAAIGWISPGIAALAMAMSSLLVVGNSLRLRTR